MQIRRGSILLYRIYDVAWEIDLSAIKGRKRLGPRSLFVSEAPVEVFIDEGSISGLNYKAFARFYSFGVVSIVLKVDASGMEAYDLKNVDESISDEVFHGYVQQVRNMYRKAFYRSSIYKEYEDYAILFVNSFTEEVDANLLRNKLDIPRILLGEKDLSNFMRRSIEENTFSYTNRDLIAIAWDYAFIYDEEGLMDVPDILEFAHVQALELRYFDDYLDRVIGETGSMLESRFSVRTQNIRRLFLIYNEIAQAQDRVMNFLKFVEDSFYAEIYRRMNHILGNAYWTRSIQTKMEILLKTYEYFIMERHNRKFQLLELSIVLLILFEILIYIGELLFTE